MARINIAGIAQARRLASGAEHTERLSEIQAQEFFRNLSQQQEIPRRIQLERELTPILIQRQIAEEKAKQQFNPFYQYLQNTQGGGQGGGQAGAPVLEGFQYGGGSFKFPEVQRREQEQKQALQLQQQLSEQQLKGVGSGEAGRVALAQESIKNIEDIKGTLFPTGQASSFRRGIATGANPPGIRIPFTASKFPFTVAPFSKESQNVFRKTGAALSGRQLIQTGVAARPEETAKLVDQFAANWASNPEAALAGLNELQDFYRSYLTTVDPLNIHNLQSPSRQNSISGTGNRIRVREKTTGRTGTVSEQSFDPTRYDRL